MEKVPPVGIPHTLAQVSGRWLGPCSQSLWFQPQLSHPALPTAQPALPFTIPRLEEL